MVHPRFPVIGYERIRGPKNFAELGGLWLRHRLRAGSSREPALFVLYRVASPEIALFGYTTTKVPERDILDNPEPQEESPGISRENPADPYKETGHGKFFRDSP